MSRPILIKDLFTAESSYKCVRRHTYKGSHAQTGKQKHTQKNLYTHARTHTDVHAGRAGCRVGTHLLDNKALCSSEWTVLLTSASVCLVFYSTRVCKTSNRATRLVVRPLAELPSKAFSVELWTYQHLSCDDEGRKWQQKPKKQKIKSQKQKEGNRKCMRVKQY